MAHGEYSPRLVDGSAAVGLDEGAAGLLVSPLAPAHPIMSRTVLVLLLATAAAAPDAPPLRAGDAWGDGFGQATALTGTIEAWKLERRTRWAWGDADGTPARRGGACTGK